MKALVIGGTGPTGPGVVNGLIERGYEVSILHTGRHEVDTIPAHVEHIHTNPFRIAEVDDALGTRTFDVVYAMYGRLRDLAPYFVGRTGQFLAVGGVPAYKGFVRPHLNFPHGMLVPVRETAERAVGDENDKVAKIVATEDIVFRHHPQATMFRYPLIYGPGQINPREPFMGHEHALHKLTVSDALIHDLGYRDLVPVTEALAITARHLRDNPVPRGSITEQRLQDPFDYATEDALVESYRAAMAAPQAIADAYDPGFRDRYAPGSDDWRLVEAKT